MKQAKTRGAMRRMALPRRAWVGLVACSVALSMMPAVSGADDLEDQQASLQQQIGASDSDVYASDAKLQDAEKTLSAWPGPRPIAMPRHAATTMPPVR